MNDRYGTLSEAEVDEMSPSVPLLSRGCCESDFAILLHDLGLRMLQIGLSNIDGPVTHFMLPEVIRHLACMISGAITLFSP